MTTTYKVLCVLIVLALLICSVLSTVLFVQQKVSGRYSPVSTVSAESSRWILARFGHCETVPELLSAIDEFGCNNFVYDSYPMPLIQAFNLDKFIFEDDLHGVCFDFSSFVKCAVLVWSDYRKRTDVQAYVYDVRLQNNGGHSYNFVMEEGHTWFLCLTTNNTRTQKGLESLGFEEVIDMSVTDYMKSYNERPYNVH